MCSLIVCSISLYCYARIKRVCYYYLKKSFRNIANKDYIAHREPLCKSLNIRVGKKQIFRNNKKKVVFLFIPGFFIFYVFLFSICVFFSVK